MNRHTLNVVPEERVRETLQMMKRSLEERITPEIGREIGQRQSVKALVNGHIAPMGRHYVITLRAVSCRSGETLAQEQVEADRKETVLRALGEATSKLRRRLGESLQSVGRYDAPLEEATTSSLEALKAYSFGRMRQRAGDDSGAIAAYEQAVRLDPNFALAWRSMSARLRYLGDRKRADECMTKALQLRERVSERERNVITAYYYLSVTSELEKAEAAYRLNLQTYPRDLTSHVHLGIVYSFTGRYEEALREQTEALRVYPDYHVPRFNLFVAYMSLNRFPEAKSAIRGAAEKKYPKLAFAAAFVEGDTAAMKRWADAARGSEREDEMLYYEALAKMYVGRRREAHRTIAEAVHIAKRKRLDEAARAYETDEALIEAEFGNPRPARALLPDADKRDGITALVMARGGNIAGAEAASAELSRRHPVHTLVQNVQIPAIGAAIHLQRGESASAVAALQIGTEYEFGQTGAWSLGRPYLRGYAYLSLGSAKEAAAEFQKILDHRGLAAISPYYPLSYLGLARAYAAAGDREKSRKAYEEFFAVWKDADADIPIYQQAKAEYSGLK